MKIYSRLDALLHASGISGRENVTREKASELIAPFVDEIKTDVMGNLIALRRARASGEEKGASVMFCAHMDEIGFLVTFIEDSGYIRVSAVGGIHATAAAYTNVVSNKGVAGLVAVSEDKKGEIKVEDLYIDIGAKNKKDAERKVAIGDWFVLTPSLKKLMGKRVCGRPLDDRIGCAVMIETAELLSDFENKGDIYYVFSVQEEVGCRGASPAAFGIAPEYSICFDVTGTGDALGATPMACSVGGGAAVKIKDRSVICHEQVVSALCDIAEREGIKYQREVLTYGGTDTSVMQLAGRGSRAGAISIPTRNIHSGVELCDIGDAEASVLLAAAFVKSL